MRSKHIKFLLLFLFVVSGLFSPLMTVGAEATELSNPSRTPSLEGDVDYDYESDYRCDYVLKTEFPELSVLLFRLYYRINAGSWSYATMSVLDSNTYKKDNFSPDDMGAIGGDDIDYYFYIKDSDNPAGEDTTATYSFTVNPDITPPVISNVVDNNAYVEPDDTVQFNATITDASGISTATLYWSSDKITWTQESMSNVEGDIWSWTSSANDFSVGTLYYFVKAVDPSANVMFSDSWDFDGAGDYYDWEEESYEGWSTNAEVYGEKSLTPTGELKVDRDGATGTQTAYAGVYEILWGSLLNQSDYSVLVSRVKLVSDGGYDGAENIHFKHGGYLGIANSGTRTGGVTYYADNLDSSAWHECVVYVADDDDWHSDGTLYLMMSGMNTADSNQMYFDYSHILWTRNFTVYDWDSPVIYTPTHVPSSDIENDDTVTVSSTMTDEDSDVDSAGIYYHDGTSWGTPSMSEGASNVWSGDISAQTYDETIDYCIWANDSYNNQYFNGQSGSGQHDFNEQLNGFLLWIGTSLTHDEDDGWANIRYSTSEIAAFRRTGYSINTANYRMFFIRWKTNTAFDQQFCGIKDATQYVSLHSWDDNYYTNYDGINSTDGWVITYGFFDSDFYDTETELRFVWHPDDYPNQDTTDADYIYVDWIHLVYPKQYSIVDVTAPALSNPDHDPVNPEHSQSVTLGVDASDSASGLDTVLCYWRVDSGSWSDAEMSGSGTYSYAIGSFNYDELIEYYFWSNDSDSNEATLNNGGSYYSFTVCDNDNPVLSVPYHNPDPVDELDKATFFVTVTDNYDVQYAYCLYRINSGSWVNMSMSEGGSNVWSYYKITYFAIGDSVEYYFQARDYANNWQTLDNAGSYYSFNVIDQTAPVLSNPDNSPNPPQDNQDTTFSIDVNDNGDIDTVLVYVKINSGSWISYEMSGSGTYTYLYSCSNYNFGDSVFFYYWSNDTYNNHDQTSEDSFNPTDATPPSILNFWYSPDSNIEWNTTVTFHVNCSDAGGLDYVRLYYKYNSEAYSYVLMSQEGATTHYYYALVVTGESADLFYFYVYALDISANSNQTSPTYETIVDVTSPVITNVYLQESNPLYTQDVVVFCSISDHYYIDTKIVHYELNDSGNWLQENLAGAGVYQVNLGKFSCLTKIDYYIQAIDVNTNDELSSTYTITIPDSIFPAITQDSVSYSQTPIRTNEGSLTVSYNITDNDAIASAAIYYKHESESIWTQDSFTLVESYYQYIFENFADDGWYYYYILAEDSSGNQEQSIFYSFYVSEAKEGEEPPVTKPDLPVLPPIIKNNPAVAIALPSTALMVIGITIIVNRISKKGKKKKKGGGYG